MGATTVPIELKPCPFCGGEASLYGGTNFESGRSAYYVECSDPLCPVCPTTPTADLIAYKTEAKAAEAWNIRAERTCRIRGGECDQCGAIIHEHANLYWAPVGEGMRTVEHRDVHYCPNCGAKVVDE